MYLKELLDDLEMLQGRARDFWKDETNSLDERIDCFNTFAETEHWVIARDNSIQRQLFDKVQEDDMFSKYETVTYEALIDIYLDDQERSEEVIERMRTYLWNKILQGDFKGFRFDW